MRDNDYDAFLNAILQTPDERINWLVFADWLEDRDDPRAEALRAAADAGAALEALYPPLDVFPDDCEPVDLGAAEPDGVFVARVETEVFPVARRVLLTKARPHRRVELLALNADNRTACSMGVKVSWRDRVETLSEFSLAPGGVLSWSADSLLITGLGFEVSVWLIGGIGRVTLGVTIGQAPL